MTQVPSNSDVVVIGGGPAGATAARLLADRGHAVVVVAGRPHDRRGLAESLPPSARKVLAAVGLLAAVDASPACPNVGNVVWWGSNEGRVEDFRGGDDVAGHQIWRPAFDRLLEQEAVASGVTWRTGHVRHVRASDGGMEVVVAQPGGALSSLTARFVVDASGRSGVMARQHRRHIAGRRMHAWIGRWRHASATASRDTRTLVETTDDGWVWSIPISATERCVTVMVDPERSRVCFDGRFGVRYRRALARAVHVRALLDDASLEDVHGCDASLYDTCNLSGPRHLVIGDAASFIDPLSSCGVKKALTSAWMSAAVVHTILTRPDLAAPARALFAAREAEAYAASVRLSTDYAAQAAAHHDTPFWTSRAALPEGMVLQPVEDDIAGGDDVAEAFAALRAAPAIDLRPAASVRFEWQPAFRDHGVELELAVSAETLRRPIRFIENVDSTRLVQLASRYRQIGDLFEGYCRRAAPVPLPNFLKALSVLVARRVLEPAGCWTPAVPDVS